MHKIVVDDRTAETPAQALEREVVAVGRLIAGFTLQVSDGRPDLGLAALAFATGVGVARTGTSLDEVVALIRQHYDGACAAMRDDPEAQGHGRPSDA